MLLNCGVGEDSWKLLGLQGDPTSPSWRRSVLGVHWKDWCWSWNSNNLATWCRELTHLKRPWCLERLRAGGEGDDRGWDGWMASPTQWTCIWVDSGNWWWTGRPGVLWFVGSQRVGHNWGTEMNWIELNCELHHDGSLWWQSAWQVSGPDRAQRTLSTIDGGRWSRSEYAWLPASRDWGKRLSLPSNHLWKGDDGPFCTFFKCWKQKSDRNDKNRSQSRF